ncbi:glutathione S-transferase [Sphingopyxis sp.]|uniref:glutathione S-transferase n=1 Tax=Sphingopyxis sp. TaxID=1908224 RepID=UPI003D11177F
MQGLPILYSFRRCPYAMRARMALIASCLAYEHREILLRDKPASMLAVSPKGTVPVLILAGGRVIDESLDIMRWALDQSDPEGWLAGADLALIADYDGAFKHHLDRYKYAVRYGDDPLVHRAAAAAMLSQLDAQLAVLDFLGGAVRGISDIAIFPFVRQFAGVDPFWFQLQRLPNVQRWLAGIAGSELFERAMVRRALWTEYQG